MYGPPLTVLPDANLITSHGSSLKAEIPPILYPSIEHDGIPCTQEISAPMKGEYSFRMGIRDFKSGHVGALMSTLPVLLLLAAFSSAAFAARGKTFTSRLCRRVNVYHTRCENGSPLHFTFLMG